MDITRIFEKPLCDAMFEPVRIRSGLVKRRRSWSGWIRVAHVYDHVLTPIEIDKIYRESLDEPDALNRKDGE